MTAKRKETFTQAAIRLQREKARRLEAADAAEDREWEASQRKRKTSRKEAPAPRMSSRSWEDRLITWAVIGFILYVIIR